MEMGNVMLIKKEVEGVWAVRSDDALPNGRMIRLRKGWAWAQLCNTMRMRGGHGPSRRSKHGEGGRHGSSEYLGLARRSRRCISSGSDSPFWERYYLYHL